MIQIQTHKAGTIDSLQKHAPGLTKTLSWPHPAQASLAWDYMVFGSKVNTGGISSKPCVCLIQQLIWHLPQSILCSRFALGFACLFLSSSLFGGFFPTPWSSHFT